MMKILIFFLTLYFNLNAQEKAILWIPSSNQAVNDFFSRTQDKNFKLAIAIPDKNGIDEEKLKTYITQKKIEILNIPEGFPFISLLYYPKNSGISYLNKINNSPYFFALRINQAAKKFKSDFKELSGIVFPYGDISKEYIQLAKAYGYLWAPVGLPFNKIEATQIQDKLTENSTNYQIINVEGFKLVPFKVLKSSSEISDFNFYLIDDTLPISSSTIDMLVDIFSAKDKKFTLPSEIINVSTYSSFSISDFNLSFIPWKAYNEYLLKDEQYGLASILSLVRSDIISYLNSNPKKTDEIFSRYISAEKYFGIYPYIENLEEAEEELRRNLEEIYQLMGKATPSFIYRSFKDINESEEKYHISITTESIVYYSVENSSISLQEIISSFSVTAKEDFLEFDINFSNFKESYFVEIYIDINGIIGLGSIKLLGKKAEKIIPNNAWEYALTTEDEKVILYQSAYNKIIKRGEYPIKKSKDNINFKIPISNLKGNFLNWDYTVLIYDKKDSEPLNNRGGIFSKIDSGYIYPVSKIKNE